MPTGTAGGRGWGVCVPSFPFPTFDTALKGIFDDKVVGATAYVVEANSSQEAAHLVMAVFHDGISSPKVTQVPEQR